MDKAKPTEPTVAPTAEEFKDQNQKYNLSKFEYDLYHEEDDVAEKIIRVKKVAMPNKNKKWKVTIDNDLIFTIEGSKLGKKERDFLETMDGFNFVLAQAKIGFQSFNKFKNDLKNKMNPEEKPVKKTRKKKK